MTATRLHQPGYAHALVYRPGKEDWIEREIPVEREHDVGS